jgi:hypothetical protein
MFSSVLVSVLAAMPVLEQTAEAPPVPPTEVFVSSLPQLGLLGVDGQLGLLPRFGLELGGWNTFKTDQNTFLRGGYLGAHYAVVHTDAADVTVGVRVLGAQPGVGVAAVAGVSGLVESHIKVFSFFAIHPDFDLTWFGGLTSARFSNELQFTLGGWRLGAGAGAQVWVRDSVAIAAPAASLVLGWRNDFGPLALDLSGQLGLTRDPAYLTHVPVLQAPRDEMSIWAGLRVGVVFKKL